MVFMWVTLITIIIAQTHIRIQLIFNSLLEVKTVLLPFVTTYLANKGGVTMEVVYAY